MKDVISKKDWDKITKYMRFYFHREKQTNVTIFIIIHKIINQFFHTKTDRLPSR